MSKAKKTRKMVMMMKKRRSLTMLLPPVVAAHPILLHPRFIINNIWTNSNQSIPASTPISRILPARPRIFPPSPPSTLGIKSVNENMRRTSGLGPETPATILLLHLRSRFEKWVTYICFFSIPASFCCQDYFLAEMEVADVVVVEDVLKCS
ncbi:unnamed protein product [Lactuca saligna]|uniref:Uncharacterized protein n=1 Tax=Lactuca saligna TaxID=75948 RepID=A0AA35VV07_LACSI|nr:unnamed protein product [Lactuca saligna]